MVLNGEAPVFQTAQPHASRPTTWPSLSCCLRWNELSCVGGADSALDDAKDRGSYRALSVSATR